MADIFRKSSLEKISNPEQLDRAITITSPMSWIALMGVFLIISVVVVWSFVGKLPYTLTSYGMITDVGNSITVYSDYSGTIKKINTKNGNKVNSGDTIAIIKKVDGTEQEIKASNDGIVSTILVEENDPVFVGSEIIKITPQIDDNQIYVCYVPISEASKIKKDLNVSLYLMSSDTSKYGYIDANVYSVGSYPVNAETISYQLGAQNLLSDQILSNGPVVVVVCRMNKDSSSKSGYHWSNDIGKNKMTPNGTFMTAKIVTDEVAPISKLLNSIKDKTEE